MLTNPIYTIANSGLKIQEFGTTAEKTLRFNENVYSLTINPSPSGTASSDAMIGTENYQTNLYATPLEGARLSGWNVTGGTITNNIFTFENSDAIVEPVFEEYVVEEVTIGNQTWMAKNLAIDDGGSGIRIEHISYMNGNDLVDLGTQYFYTQGAAIRVAESTAAEGWHLPTTAECKTLSSYASPNPGITLRSTYGWITAGGGMNGTDDYGFCALPVGQYDNSTATNKKMGINACYWTTKNGVNFWTKNVNYTYVTGNTNTGTYNPVRLIKDTP